jgi:hypothetical protein
MDTSNVPNASPGRGCVASLLYGVLGTGGGATLTPVCVMTLCGVGPAVLITLPFYAVVVGTVAGAGMLVSGVTFLCFGIALIFRKAPRGGTNGSGKTLENSAAPAVVLTITPGGDPPKEVGGVNGMQFPPQQTLPTIVDLPASADPPKEMYVTPILQPTLPTAVKPPTATNLPVSNPPPPPKDPDPPAEASANVPAIISQVSMVTQPAFATPPPAGGKVNPPNEEKAPENQTDTPFLPMDKSKLKNTPPPRANQSSGLTPKVLVKYPTPKKPMPYVSPIASKQPPPKELVNSVRPGALTSEEEVTKIMRNIYAALEKRKPSKKSADDGPYAYTKERKEVLLRELGNGKKCVVESSLWKSWKGLPLIREIIVQLEKKAAEDLVRVLHYRISPPGQPVDAFWLELHLDVLLRKDSIKTDVLDHIGAVLEIHPNSDKNVTQLYDELVEVVDNFEKKPALGEPSPKL